MFYSKVVLLGMLAMPLLLAEDAPVAADMSGAPAAAPAVLAADKAAPSAAPAQSPFSRWFDVNTASFSLRYRSIFDSDGVHTYDQAQQRSLLDGHFKFDEQGKYSIGFHFSSGHYFDWAYSDFAGGGTTEALHASIPRLASVADRLDAIESGPQAAVYQSGGWSFVPRQLYFDAKPVDGLEFQYGSLGIERGVNTEITSYDEDGYIAGGRMTIRKPQYLFFDQVSVTYAYLGDITTPNFFDRYDRLGHSNYHQFLVRKKLAPWLEISTDYTRHIAHTMREAAYVKTKWAKVSDGVRFEAYQRPNAVNGVDTDNYPSGSGYAVSVDKSFRKRVLLTAGFADIDTEYDVYSANGNNAIWAFALNGDQYGLGKRPFVRATVNVAPYLQLVGFYTHLVDYNYARDGFIWNQTALSAGIQIDFKKMLKLESAR